MPLPILIILGVGTAVMGAIAGVHGGVKMKKANDTMKYAQSRHEDNIAKFKKENEATTEDMDKLGKSELEILESFSEFSDVFERIKNRPEFDAYSKNGVTLPEYDGEKIKTVSVGAGVILGALGGAGLGAAGGFAAAGATTAAVMAVGTASTGAAISSLSGVAATNATLALLGGGTLAMGGGGMAAGAAALGTASLGAGLLIGGIIFNIVGKKLSDKADEAQEQMIKAEQEINTICDYLVNLRDTSNRYYETLSVVNAIYRKHLESLKCIVTVFGHTNWNSFTSVEKKLTENTVLLVGLLYNMCKVELVIKSEDEGNINAINVADVEKSIYNANTVIDMTKNIDKLKADMFIAENSRFFPEDKIDSLKEKLYAVDDSKFMTASAVKFKDPNVLLIISIFLGGLGIDRFMLKDTGFGILKLFTLGCCGVLTVMDWFTVRKRTKELNYNNLMAVL